MDKNQIIRSQTAGICRKWPVFWGNFKPSYLTHFSTKFHDSYMKIHLLNESSPNMVVRGLTLAGIGGKLVGMVSVRFEAPEPPFSSVFLETKRITASWE
ncbi:hypothetical protein C1H46_045634 [Malus baccata]|uniref:Uncharacterized protein n=1 Tax=Malus baccata TaxID=106549 RepID=A0A540K3M5_MALBA|nr:hypothetical protein C1H46_045634 [Malus baccata]